MLLLLVFIVLAIFPGQIAPVQPDRRRSSRPALGPSGAHWLGTTAYGQDIFSQLIWGTRLSLVIALAVGGLATVLAVLVGVSAALPRRRRPTAFLSLVTDVILVLPIFPLDHRDRRLREERGPAHADRRARRARLVVRGPAAPLADAVAAAGATSSSRRASAGERKLLRDPLRDPADDDLAHRGDLPRRRALRRPHRRGAAVHRARRPEQPELGDDALLGRRTTRRSVAGMPLLGDRARRLRRAPRRRLRAPQLRVRRDQQPGPARPASSTAHGCRRPSRLAGPGAGRSRGRAVLEVEDLTVAYATDAGPVVAVDHVDLELARGEFLAHRRRVGLRQVDAAVRDRAAARRADGRRDRRRAASSSRAATSSCSRRSSSAPSAGATSRS